MNAKEKDRYYRSEACAGYFSSWIAFFKGFMEEIILPHLKSFLALGLGDNRKEGNFHTTVKI